MLCVCIEFYKACSYHLLILLFTLCIILHSKYSNMKNCLHHYNKVVLILQCFEIYTNSIYFWPIFFGKFTVFVILMLYNGKTVYNIIFAAFLYIMQINILWYYVYIDTKKLYMSGHSHTLTFWCIDICEEIYTLHLYKLVLLI